jgi:MYXO-CTERM domain-containing protein
MRVASSILAALVVLVPARAFATTWDEPWHDDVVRGAGSFVKAELTSVAPDGSRAEAHLLAQVAGQPVPERFALGGFYGLRLTSLASDEPPAIHLRAGATYYFFLKREPAGTFSTATPTSGMAPLDGQDVIATYRHSYHRAIVPEALYVASQTVIFHALHGEPWDVAAARGWYTAYLSRPPAAAGGEKSDPLFFQQHVALETWFHTGAAGVDPARALPTLEPFLAMGSAHVQISAVRALGVVGAPAVDERLMKFIEGDGDGFAKVMAAWALQRRKAVAMLPRLRAYAASGADAEVGFGGNIMDPRVGTSFPPSVKAAVAAVADALGAPDAPAQVTSTRPTADATPNVPPPVPPRATGCGACATQGSGGDVHAWTGAAAVAIAIGARRRRRRHERARLLPAAGAGATIPS